MVFIPGSINRREWAGGRCASGLAET